MTTATVGSLAVRLSTAVRQPRTRVFAAPAAGRGASALWSWLPHVPDGVELWAVRLPGRESSWHEPPPSSVQQVARQLADDIEQVARVGGAAPVALLGHSLGAYVAHACAATMTGRGAPPSRLIVAGAGTPRARPARLRHLLADDQLTDELVGFGATPAELLASPELLQLFLPLLRADFRLAETYAPAPGTLGCRLDAFAAVDDWEVPVTHVEAWREMTTGPFRLHRTSGGHFFPDEAPAALLECALD